MWLQDSLLPTKQPLVAKTLFMSVCNNARACSRTHRIWHTDLEIIILENERHHFVPLRLISQWLRCVQMPSQFWMHSLACSPPVLFAGQRWWGRHSMSQSMQFSRDQCMKERGSSFLSRFESQPISLEANTVLSSCTIDFSLYSSWEGYSKLHR